MHVTIARDHGSHEGEIPGTHRRTRTSRSDVAANVRPGANDNRRGLHCPRRPGTPTPLLHDALARYTDPCRSRVRHSRIRRTPELPESEGPAVSPIIRCDSGPDGPGRPGPFGMDRRSASALQSLSRSKGGEALGRDTASPPEASRWRRRQSTVRCTPCLYRPSCLFILIPDGPRPDLLAAITHTVTI